MANHAWLYIQPPHRAQSFFFSCLSLNAIESLLRTRFRCRCFPHGNVEDQFLFASTDLHILSYS